MGQAFPAPTFGHAAEAFVIAHAAPGAWSAGTAVKYRQTLAVLGGQLDGAGQAAASDVAVLGTPAGASALEAAFTAAFGQLAPAVNGGLGRIAGAVDAHHVGASKSTSQTTRVPAVK